MLSAIGPDRPRAARPKIRPDREEIMTGRQAPWPFAALALLLMAAAANAQSYPDKPIKIIVPAASGGPTDVPARLAAQILQPKLGQPVVVENRAGAGGALGARAVAAAPPDGYTLLAGNTSVLAVGPAVSASAGYHPVTNFAAVAKVSESYQILVVQPSRPWKTVEDLVDDAKAHPAKLNYGHTGAGGLPHLTGELFMARSDAKLTGVPFRSGGEAVTAVLSGTVEMTFESVTILLPLIREGKLRALAVTSGQRTPLAPDLPTMMEAGVPNYEVTTFNGIAAPAGTPAKIVGLLSAAMNEGLKSDDIQATIKRLGAVSTPGTPAEFSAFIAAQYGKWQAVAKDANIKVD
jgi:tripartite-type tricarboxylate transporter receptor subunit TctC